MAEDHPFEPDPAIDAIADAYSLDAVDLARMNFGVRLNWSIESLRAVEIILTQLHDAIPEKHPSEDTIVTFSKAFGSYVGEVIRREHGGCWGWVTLQGNRIVGVQFDHPRIALWPWSRVYKRLKDGPEENVWHYYQLTVLYEKEHPSGA